MTTISALIDFLMNLMSDEKTKREFEQNPDGTMADRGLQDVSAQDVRDARLIMADQGHARPRPDSGGGSHANGYHESGLAAGGGSAVREIVHTTQTFEIDQSKMIFNIDNHRTNILDSFNSSDKVTAIQDNDTVIDIDQDDDEDETDKTDDKTEDPEDKIEDPSDDPDGTEDTPDDPEDKTGDEPGVPGDEELPDGGPGPDTPPAEDGPNVPMPEGDPNSPIDPGDGIGDGSDQFPTEPDPVPEEEPVLAEADDDLPVA